jgi:hypothetical protein
VPLAIPFGRRTLFQNIVLSVSFSIWGKKKAKSKGAKSDEYGGCGTIAMRVGGQTVVMKKPVVVATKFRSFSSHIFSQASQNLTIKVGNGLCG